jgi:hypothetical protein
LGIFSNEISSTILKHFQDEKDRKSRNFDVKIGIYFLQYLLMFLATIIFTALARKFERTQDESNISGQEVFENYIYVDEVQSTNLEENFLQVD